MLKMSQVPFELINEIFTVPKRPKHDCLNRQKLRLTTEYILISWLQRQGLNLCLPQPISFQYHQHYFI